MKLEKLVHEKLDALALLRPGTTYFSERMPDVCAVYACLADEESRDVFLRVVKARSTGNPNYIPVSAYGEYQHPLVSAVTGDVVCDGGVYEGLSTFQHSLRVGPTGRVYAFDPESTNMAIAKSNLRACSNVIFEGLALFSEETDLHIAYFRDSSHIRTHAHTASQPCLGVTLDGYLARKGERCDLISLDVEGAEPEILKGAMQTIRRYKPKLQISIYHFHEHMLEIPLMLMRENLGYSFYMGHHSTGYFQETILYAAPQSSEIAKGRGVSEQAANDAAERTAGQLAGQDVFFWGAGAAYERYKKFFHKSRPVAILLDRRFLEAAGRNEIDGIPLRTPESLNMAEKELPIILFMRAEHLPAAFHTLNKHLPEQTRRIYACIL